MSQALSEFIVVIGTTFAVVTSIVSIVVSIVALRMQRKHDYKSVLPIPQLDVGDYEDRIFVAIENAGVGPMIIDNIEVRSEATGRTNESVIAFVSELPPHFFWNTFIEKIVGRAIPAQEKLIILDFSGTSAEIDKVYFPEARKKVQEHIRSVLAALSVTLDVKDVYGNKMPRYVRSLDWFKRDHEVKKKRE